MKKIIITLFCAGIVVTSFAQSDFRQDDRDDHYVYNQRGDHGNAFLSERDRNFRIAQINREFDFKVRAIEYDYNLKRHQKKVAIRNAEAERRMQIRSVKFNRDRHDRDWDHDGDRH